MKSITSMLLCLLVITSCSSRRQLFSSQSTIHRENGWYHVLSGQTDTLSSVPIVASKDFAVLRLDTDAFGKYAIYGQVHPYYFEHWTSETEKAIGKQIAFVFNDSVITNPRVNCRIESGNFVITSHCDKKLPAIYEKLNSEINLSYQDSLSELTTKKLWQEANDYKSTLTDTTFLQTKGIMSYSAIDPMTGNGFNRYYAYNQVVYLKALDKARGRLSIKDERLFFSCKSGRELNISDDLFLFICSLFEEWNQWLDSGKYEITKDEQGLYTVVPIQSKDKEAYLDSLWRKDVIWRLGATPIKDTQTIDKAPKWAKWDYDLEKYYVSQMKYPKELLKKNVAGYSVVMFSVDTLGLPREINILTTIHKEFDKEVIRLTKELPHCLPCRDKNGKRMECFYTVYVPFLPQRYRNRVKADSIAEEELKHCFVEWEELAKFQDGKQWSPQNYICQSLKYDACLLGEQQKAKGVYKIHIDSYGEIKEAKTLRSCGIPQWDEEVERIIRNMPRWTPTIHHRGKGGYKDAIWAIPVIFENNHSPHNVIE